MMSYQTFGKQQKYNLDKRVDCLEAIVDGITNAIDNLECYSYQYNAKLVGIPEHKAMESLLETSKLCVQLFK
jgi:hypothetical protein